MKLLFASHRFWLTAILAAFLLLGVLYSAIMPLFEPPDEIWHFAFANHLASGNGLPVFSVNKSALLREGGQPPLFYAAVALAILPLDRSDFPGFVRFNASHPNVTPGATSDTGNVFIHTDHENFPWKNSVLAVHIARLVSLAFGALALAGVYVAGRIVTSRQDLALLSMALVAFTPEFIYISSSVNNDSLMAATATWAGVAALQVAGGSAQDKGRGRWRKAAWLGFWLGLGLLAKLSAVVLVPLAGAALLIGWLRSRGGVSHIRGWVVQAAIVFGLAGLISGWWYLRNIALYGDPLGWSVWLSDIGTRNPTPAVWQLVPEFPALFRTFWADFGGLQFGDVIYLALAIVALLALLGLFKAWRSAGRLVTGSRLDIWNWVFVLTWLGIVLAGVVQYMRTTPAAQGRLLFPAFAPIGLLLICGLAAWSRRPWLPYFAALGLLALALAVPFALVRPAFARPLVARVPAGVQPANARFGEWIELAGVRFSSPNVQSGGMLRVTTYWRVLQEIPRDQRLLIRLMRSDGQSAGQLDAQLGTNLYPATLWRPGQIVVDEHDVRADAGLQPGLGLHVHVGVGDAVEPLLPVTGRMAWGSGDVADVGQVQVQP